MNLNSKLENIRTQKEQVIAQYNALLGAEQILLEVIKESEEDESNEHSDN